MLKDCHIGVFCSMRNVYITYARTPLGAPGIATRNKKLLGVCSKVFFLIANLSQSLRDSGDAINLIKLRVLWCFAHLVPFVLEVIAMASNLAMASPKSNGLPPNSIYNICLYVVTAFCQEV